MNLSRRGLITGLISFAAAPAIVRIESLMPVKVMEPYGIGPMMIIFRTSLPKSTWRLLNRDNPICDSEIIRWLEMDGPT